MDEIIDQPEDEAPARPEAVNRLLAELDDPQAPARRLLEIVWDDYARRGRWPVFDCAERMIGRHPDHPDVTATLLQECPWVMYYGRFWVTQPSE